MFRIGNSLVRWLATALIMLVPASVQGASEEQANAAQAQEKETEQASASAPEESAPGRDPSRSPAEGSAEVFLPTEEISEDYAAPFPVDI